MKVLIVGAGIAGLTVAHELVEMGFQVDVYERDSIAGGMARSVRTPTGVPSEHSWRGYAPFYYNTFEIMSRIPIQKKLHDGVQKRKNIVTFKGDLYDFTEFIPKHPGGTIIQKMLSTSDSLEKVWKDNKVEWHMKNPYIMNLLEKYKIGGVKPPDVLDNLAKSGIEFKLLTNKRDGDTKINPIDYPYLSYLFVKNAIVNKRRTNSTKLTDVTWPLQETSRQFLLDYVSGPGYGFDMNRVSTNHYFGFIYHQLYAGNHSWQVMNQPTNEAWIDPWVEYLTSKGVGFHFNSNVTSVTPGGVIIDGELVRADDYVSTIPPKLEIPNDQISFRFGFNRKVSFEQRNVAFVLLDSEYNITFYSQDEHWSRDVNIGPVASLWSGTIINGTKAVKLHPDELLTEIKRQFLSSTYIKCKISAEDIVYQEIFEDWHWDDGKMRLVSKNPKWVNHVNEVRPVNSTEYPNVWLAGAHTKTSIDVWSMESAVESGKMASNLILSKYKLKKCRIIGHEINIGKVDDLFYTLGLPHILDCFLIVLVSYIISKTLIDNNFI
jgi:cytochrome b involved in lipid metabolism